MRLIDTILLTEEAREIAAMVGATEDSDADWEKILFAFEQKRAAAAPYGYRVGDSKLAQTGGPMKEPASVCVRRGLNGEVVVTF